MSIFDYIINVIEPLLLSSFIAFYFDIPKKKEYILCCIPIFFSFTTFHNLTGKYEMTTFLLALIMLILGIWVFQKKKSIESIIIVCISGLFLMLSNYIALFFSAVLFEMQTHVVLATSSTYMFAVSLSKIILALSLLVLYMYLSRVKGTLVSKHWWILVILSATVLISVTIILHPFIYKQYMTTTMLLVLAISIVMIAILFIFTFYRIQKESQEKMSYALAAQKHQFLADNYNKIQSVSEKMTETEHRLMYVLLQVRGCLDNQDNENAKMIVDQYIKKIKQFDTVISTGNPYFDFVFSKKIDNYILENIELKINLQIQRNERYEAKEFCNIVLSLLMFGDKYIISSNRSLSIREENQFVIINYQGQVETEKRIVLPDTIIQLIEEYKGIYDITKVEDIMIIKIVLEL